MYELIDDCVVPGRRSHWLDKLHDHMYELVDAISMSWWMQSESAVVSTR